MVYLNTHFKEYSGCFNKMKINYIYYKTILFLNLFNVTNIPERKTCKYEFIIVMENEKNINR